MNEWYKDENAPCSSSSFLYRTDCKISISSSSLFSWNKKPLFRTCKCSPCAHPVKRYPLWTVPDVFYAVNTTVKFMLLCKKILYPQNRSCMKSGCGKPLWLPMFIPQRNFFLFMLQSIHQRPLPFLLLPSFCLPAIEKMRSTVRIFLLHQFSSALIIPQNICVIAENHLLFPAYPLKC